MSKVAVLLSAYNGEKYIKEQIDSILKQKGVEVELFVRDDGSKDSTKDILEAYKQEYVNFHYELAENVGVGNSFMNLLYAAPNNYDFYAFSDQDDIWKEEKLFEAVKMLNETDNWLYASNQECVDKNGNFLYIRYSKETKIHLTPNSILNNNMVSGCTMVLANAFYKLLVDENRRPTSEILRNRIHDVWVAMVGAVCKKIVYDERSFIKYRQHENNVVGASKDSFKKRLKERIKKFKNPALRNGRSLLAKEIVEKFPKYVDEFPFVKVSANNKKFKDKLKIIKYKKEICSYSNEKSIALTLKILFGLY